MNNWYMTAKDGEIYVYDRIMSNGPARFQSDDLNAVAEFVVENDIDKSGWMNSSSMDFGTEYGFDEDNLRGEIWAIAMEIRATRELDETPHRIRVVLGEHAARAHANGETSIAKLSDLGAVSDYAFKTEAELKAFMEGLEAAIGWMEWTEYSPDPVDGEDEENEEEQEDGRV